MHESFFKKVLIQLSNRWIVEGLKKTWNQTFSILLTLNPLPAAIIAFAVALITPKGLFSSLLKEIQFVMSSKKECFNFVIQRGSWKPTKNVIDLLCDINLEANLLDWNDLEMIWYVICILQIWSKNCNLRQVKWAKMYALLLL